MSLWDKRQRSGAWAMELPQEQDIPIAGGVSVGLGAAC